MNLGPKYVAWWLVLLALHVGCSHSPPLTRIEGDASFRIIEPPPPPPSSIKSEGVAENFQPTEVLVPAEPLLPLSKPVYPRAALGSISVPVLVGVQISVDSSGRVTAVSSSRRAISTPGRMAAEFLAAVEETVAQWRFKPAEKRAMKPMKGRAGQDDFWLVTRVDKTDYVFDVSFTFAVSGEVTSGQPK